MDAVFQKTRELGQALIESEAYQQMKAAEDKAARNQEAADTMNHYLELRGQIQEILSRENPDSAVLKRLSDEMDATQEKLFLLYTSESAPAILAAVEQFCAAEHVMGVRRTKSGEREIDMRPLALSLEAREGSLYARLMLTERDTLKPDALLLGLASLAGVEAPRARVHRLLSLIHI